MDERDAERLVEEATQWWSTSIIDIHPGEIRIRGYAIQELIGRVSLPEMIWLMLRGELPSAEQSRLLEAALVAAVDHGPQAPSIAVSRMAVTCGLPLNGAMASAINLLDDVHGGAGEQCMNLLHGIVTQTASDAAVTPTVVDAALDAFIAANGKIIPGFGHRFHPVDPRTGKLLDLVARARGDGVISGRYAHAAAQVAVCLGRRRQKPIPMNIDGVTAVIYSELGFAPPLGRGLFLLSRSVGILAHAWEQMNQGGRIKGPMPKSVPYSYTGAPPRSFPPVERDV